MNFNASICAIVLAFFSYLNLIVCTIINSFDDSSNSFTNIVLGEDGKSLFVGSTENKIFGFSSNLGLQNVFVPDSHSFRAACYSNLHCVNSTANCTSINTNSSNYLVPVFSTTNHVLICGSTFEGACIFTNYKLEEESYLCELLLPKPINYTSSNFFLAKKQSGERVWIVSFDVHDLTTRTLLSARRFDNFSRTGIDLKVSANVDSDSQMYRYILSFQKENLVYHVVSHKVSRGSSSNGGFIMQSCLNNLSSSLVEVPIKMFAKGVNAKEIIDSTYSNFSIFILVQHSNKSVLFTVDLRDVESHMSRVINDCLSKGEGFKAPYYVQSDGPTCSAMGFIADKDYCSQIISHHQIFSQDPVIANLSYEFDCPHITKVVYDPNADVLFASCRDGTILKLQVNMEPNLTMKVIDTMVDVKENASSPFVLDMRIGREDDLFVLTNHSVLRLMRNSCSSRSTCQFCLADPQCGWCAPLRRCSAREHCTSKSASSASVELMWLQKCVEILSVSPSKSPIKSLKRVKFLLAVSFIPEPNSTICQGGSSETLVPQQVDANVTVNENGQFQVECQPFGDIPTAMVNRQVTSSTLFISIVSHGIILSETSVMLIVCSNFKSCETCFVSSGNLCLWCPKTHTCVDSSLVDTCHRDSFYTLDQATCPYVVPGNSTVLLPVDHPVDVTLKVYYLTSYQIEKQLYCRVGSKPIFPAAVQKFGSSTDVWNVTCTIEMRKGQILESHEIFDLDLVWGEDKNVIKSSKILQAEVFDCTEMGKNCGQCLLLELRFDCVLCEDRFCIHSSSCSGPFKKGTTNMCTNPVISSFHPQGAPLHSEDTLVTILGSNLPFTLQDINITIATLPCKIDADLSHLFEMGEKIVCRLAHSEVERKGQVVLSSSYSAKSGQDFVFKDPELSGMHPLRGPRSGKTLVTIAGQNLHFGSKVVVEVNNIQGEVIRRNETTIFFLTPPCHTPSVGVIGFNVKVDGVTLKSTGVMQFTYMDDPQVTIIDPNLALKSGGNIVGIRGVNLKNVQHPQFIVYIGNENRTSDCRRDGSSTYMECPTPNLTGLKVKLPMRLECGLVMDGVVGLLRLGWNHSKTILYNSDPVLEPLERPIRYMKTENKLVLNGQDLHVLQSFTDLVISVNNASCEKAFINSSNIICDLPDLTRVPLDNGKATVVVSLGNFKREVGEVEYGTKKMPLIITITCVIIGLVILFIIALIILIKLYRRRHANANFQSNFLLKHTTTSASAPLRPLNSDTAKTSPSVKATSPVKDDVTYFEEALQRIESAKIKNVARNVFVSRNKIQLESLIGRGSFTRVHLANIALRNQYGYETDTKVSVKVIEDSNMSERTLDAFIRETAIMNNFKHDNVLNILAICLGHHKEPWVVLPFMTNGDLRTFIKDKTKTFTARQLLQMAQQVAGGMAYLSSLDFVHRELCARNCLLDENLNVKVSDFGLTTELHEKEFFSSSPLKFDRLPIKWMAIESIENFIFTSKSDVWSFGVLMWELMTRGVVPYPDVQSQQIRFLITSGRRLKKPKYCPPVVYNMMMDCWQEIPERRPTFTDLVNRLELLLNPPRKKDSQTEQLDETEPLYINTTDPQSPGYAKSQCLF